MLYKCIKRKLREHVTNQYETGINARDLQFTKCPLKIYVKLSKIHNRLLTQ